MKRLLLILLIISALCKTVICQQQDARDVSITFYGVVLDASTLTPIPNSQISVNSIFSSVSAKDGSFMLRVMRNDTILFSVLGYKPVVYNVSDTLSGREFNAGIFMQADTLAIGEVVIVPRIVNIRSEILNAQPEQNIEMDNARFNMAVSRYQGITGQGNLGDPATNYEVLRQRQIIDAYEKGGIPSDKMIGLSPFLLIPAAYLLIHGLPESPPPLKPGLSKRELDQIFRKYLETSQMKK